MSEDSPDIIERIKAHIANFPRSKVNMVAPTTGVAAVARVGDPIKHKSFWGALAGAVTGALMESALICVCSFAFGGLGALRSGWRCSMPLS